MHVGDGWGVLPLVWWMPLLRCKKCRISTNAYIFTYITFVEGNGKHIYKHIPYIYIYTRYILYVREWYRWPWHCTLTSNIHSTEQCYVHTGSCTAFRPPSLVSSCPPPNVGYAAVFVSSLAAGLGTSKHSADTTGAKGSCQSGARKKDRAIPSQVWMACKQCDMMDACKCIRCSTLHSPNVHMLFILGHTRLHWHSL